MTILGQESVTRIRYAAGTRDSLGRWVDGASTSSTILMSVQPLNEAERQELLAEGVRKAVDLKGYTSTECRTSSQYDQTMADRIVVDGITYEVVGVARERAVIPHYKVWLGRLDESDA